MIKVVIAKGITIPYDLIKEKEDESLGLGFWFGRMGSGWINVTLVAESYTIVVSNDKGNIAYVPCFKRKILPWLVLMSGYPYTLVFGDDKLFFNNVDLVINACSQQGIARIELTVSGRDLQLVDHLAKLGNPAIKIIDKTKFTRQIVNIHTLSQANDLVSAYRGKLRWSINKAIKTGVSCSILVNESVASAHKLYVEVMQEKGAPTYYSQDRFQYIVDILAPEKQGIVYLAHLNSKIVGMAAVIYSDKSAHLIQVAVLRRFAKNRIGDFIVAFAQYEAAKAGKIFFDFMATPEFESGVKEYKAKWGGKTEKVETIVITIKKVRAYFIELLRYLSRKFSRYNVSSN